MPEVGCGRRLVVKLVDWLVPPKRFEVGRAADARLRRYIEQRYDGVLVNEVRLGDRGGFFSRTSGWRVVGDHFRLTTVASTKTREKVTRSVVTRRMKLPVFLSSRPVIISPR